jgi:hypothetical protein
MERIFNKKIISLLIAIALYIFLTPYVLADKTVKTVEIFGGFIENVQADTPYSKDFTFKSPDGFDKLYYVKAKFRADNYNGQIARFYVKLDDNFCTPNYYDIPPETADYEMIFDCTDLFNHKGTYTGGFQSNQDLKFAYGEWQITYLNNPLGSLDLFGTEYDVNQKGTSWVQLRNTESEPVNDGDCYINVWKPQLPNATHPIWIQDAPMLYLSDSDGLYYYDFIVPEDPPEGVYMMSARCSYIYDWEWYFDADELFGADRYVEYGVYEGDTIVLNSFVDYEYTKCTAGVCGGANKCCYADYNYTLDNTTFDSFNLFWMGETDEDVDLTMYVWNYTDDSWVMLPNILTTTGTGYNYPIGINEFLSNSILNLNDTIGIYDGDYQMRIRVESIANRIFIQFDNWLSLRASQEGDFLVDMRGSGEIHVSSGNVTGVTFVGQVENVTNVANALATFGQLKYAGGTEYLSGTDGTIIYQFLRIDKGDPVPINDADYCNTTAWYPNGTLLFKDIPMTYLNDSNALYYYDFTVPYIEGIYRTQAECFRSIANVRGHSASTFHVENLDEEIWDYENRTLTDYNQSWINSKLNNISNDVDKNYNFLQDFNTTMTEFYLDLNQTMFNQYNETLYEIYYLQNVLQTVYDWLEYSATVLS